MLPTLATTPGYETLPRLGTAEEFAALRKLLVDSGYTEPGICARLGVKNMLAFSPEVPPERPIEQPLDVLIRFFFDCVAIHEDRIQGALPQADLALLENLNLVTRRDDRPGMLFAPAAILPAYDFFTLCDHDRNVFEGTKRQLETDVVYPAILNTTRGFLKMLPDRPCEAMLDVGTGTGIAAMLGAHNAQHVWATDITERSAHFAEFNRRLAGIENMTAAAGDMYAPVAGLTFDRITIHPPYVPSRQSKMVYRDAGEDGEQILRRAV